jgi:hypothetical protein
MDTQRNTAVADACQGLQECDVTDLERARGQEDQILSMLQAAGPAGCANSQLWRVCHAVNSRISDLRKRGHKITAESEGGGTWRYRLIHSVAPRPANSENPKPVTDSADWFTSATGKSRPSATTESLFLWERGR